MIQYYFLTDNSWNDICAEFANRCYIYVLMSKYIHWLFLKNRNFVYYPYRNSFFKILSFIDFVYWCMRKFVQFLFIVYLVYLWKYLSSSNKSWRALSSCNSIYTERFDIFLYIFENRVYCCCIFRRYFKF